MVDLVAAMKRGKKNSLTREQAMELYKDLQKNVNALRARQAMDDSAAPKKKNTPTARPAAPMASSLESRPSGGNSLQSENAGGSGSYIAISCVVFFAVAKVVLGLLEYSGVASASKAEASYVAVPRAPFSQVAIAPQSTQSQPGQGVYSKEELAILTSLDGRRTELEERNKKLDEREADLDRRDREYATRQTQLREMTELLRNDREKNDKKRSTQLDQLANVYGSMDPKEAAGLIEQLDVTIALSLLERMPEKRIGQILALMNPQRALSITKMLSGKVG